MAVINKYHHGNKLPDGTINIMRGTIFGNPFIIGKDGTREEVIEKYKQYAIDRVKTDPEFAKQVASLINKDLCCCCAPAPCHGNILEQLAKELNNKLNNDFQTTAIYPNRIADKEKLEFIKNLTEFPVTETKFYTKAGTLFADGYIRLVFGDHGPYIEFSKEQIVCELKKKFDNPLPTRAFYEWFEPSDGSVVKVYVQRRDVRHLKNPPKGGFNGNRSEGYADYRVGFIYVNPYQLDVVFDK